MEELISYLTLPVSTSCLLPGFLSGTCPLFPVVVDLRCVEGLISYPSIPILVFFVFLGYLSGYPLMSCVRFTYSHISKANKVSGKVDLN